MSEAMSKKQLLYAFEAMAVIGSVGLFVLHWHARAIGK
jgi:hypothetical protein